MRRLWVTAVAIVVCLALCGLPVMAQDKAAAVTASHVCDPASDTGATVSCTVTASDPRVTGTATVGLTDTSQVSVGQDGGIVGVQWGDFAHQGPEGSWSGYWYLVFGMDGTAHPIWVGTADQACAGWTYITLATVPFGSVMGDFIGVIYQGAPPAWWPLPTAAPPATPSPRT